jgi:hypothetical protein
MLLLCSGTRAARRRARVITSTAAALTIAAALAAPAGAAVTLPHSIAVFYHRDFVQASGFHDGELVNVTASRNGVVIGTATDVPAIDSAPGLGDGLVTVNHPGGSCWDTVTPDLRPGDVVTTTAASGTDSTSVANVEITQQATRVGGDIVVKGYAADAAGNPLPLDQIQERMVAGNPLPLFDKNGKRTLRAGANGSEGALAYDAVNAVTNPRGINWTATYTGLDATDMATAVAAESRMIWLGPNPTLVNAAGFPAEATFAEVGGDKPATPGPGSPECPALARNAVTSVDPGHLSAGRPAINLADRGSDLTVSGVANDATTIAVTLTDSTGRKITQTATPTPAGGAQTWSATFAAADVQTLADGPITASGAYTVTGTPISGATLALVKDLVAPAPPTASVPSGSYPAAQAVALNDADGSAVVHHTEDGSAPGLLSPTFNPVSVTASQTLSAVAIDPAGNPSPIAHFVYRIAPAASGVGLPPSTVITALPVAPQQQVQGVRTVAGPAVRGLGVAVLRGSGGLRVTIRLGSGAHVVRFQVFRARNGREAGPALVTVTRVPPATGRYVVTLRGRALRTLRPGRYILEARAGTSRATVGPASRRTFVVG